MLIMIGWPSQCASRYAVTEARPILLGTSRCDSTITGALSSIGGACHAAIATRMIPAAPRARRGSSDQWDVVANPERMSFEIGEKRQCRAGDKRQRQNDGRFDLVVSGFS